MKFICIIQGQYRMYQRVVPSQIVKRKWLKISDEFSIVQGEQIILLNDVPDAIHDTVSDKLYFSDFSVLKAFFSKIEELYREATDAEVQAFLRNEIIKASADFTSEKVSKPNRQRIALAQEKIGTYTKQNLEQLLQEFPDYIKDVEIKGGAFSISDERKDELIRFLDAVAISFIDQAYGLNSTQLSLSARANYAFNGAKTHANLPSSGVAGPVDLADNDHCEGMINKFGPDKRGVRHLAP